MKAYCGPYTARGSLYPCGWPPAAWKAVGTNAAGIAAGANAVPWPAPARSATAGGLQPTWARPALPLPSTDAMVGIEELIAGVNGAAELGSGTGAEAAGTLLNAPNCCACTGVGHPLCSICGGAGVVEK